MGFVLMTRVKDLGSGWEPMYYKPGVAEARRQVGASAGVCPPAIRPQTALICEVCRRERYPFFPQDAYPNQEIVRKARAGSAADHGPAALAQIGDASASTRTRPGERLGRKTRTLENPASRSQFA
jgi:hypothetical protein